MVSTKDNIIEIDFGNVSPGSARNMMRQTDSDEPTERSKPMTDSEKVYDYIREDMKQLEQRIQHMTDDANARSQESEERIRQERKGAEARTNKLIDEMRSDSQRRADQIDARFERMEGKIDRMGDKIEESNKSVRNISITTILGIAAMVIAVIVAIFAKG